MALRSNSSIDRGAAEEKRKWKMNSEIGIDRDATTEWLRCVAANCAIAIGRDLR